MFDDRPEFDPGITTTEVLLWVGGVALALAVATMLWIRLRRWWDEFWRGLMP